MSRLLRDKLIQAGFCFRAASRNSEKCAGVIGKDFRALVQTEVV